LVLVRNHKIIPARLFCSHRHLGPALRTVGVVGNSGC
jgi:hypothetical protein